MTTHCWPHASSIRGQMVGHRWSDKDLQFKPWRYVIHIRRGVGGGTRKFLELANAFLVRTLNGDITVDCGRTT